jgi:hypothetical protein
VYASARVRWTTVCVVLPSLSIQSNWGAVVQPLIAGGTPLRDIEVPRSIEGVRVGRRGIAFRG